MTSRIFRCILAAAAVVLAASLVVITGVLYKYFDMVHQEQLKDELNLAARAVEQLGTGYLEKLDADHSRLTWVSADGGVLYDSHAEAESMENHSDREEIAQALASGAGSSVRHSATLMEETVYEATRLADGSVLRISVSHATALSLVLGMLQPIAFVLVTAIALSAFLAHGMAKRVVEPLNRLDLEKPLENDTYEELAPLLHRIHLQHREIESRMQALRHKQDEFDKITGSMKEALVLLDREGRILSINPAAEALFHAEDGVGKDFMTVDRKQSMRAALEKAGQQGHADFRDSTDGKVWQFDVSRIDSDEGSRGTVILAFDVTEQVNAEKHRREFTANVSHELKTPLQSIIGAAELMENGLVEQEDVPAFICRIRTEAARLIALIEDIIRLSELDEGREMQREEVSLRTVCEETCALLADAARQKNVSLSVMGDAGVIPGMKRLLQEAVFNLCDNAIRYNVSGGSVQMTVKESGDAVRLCVKDTGIGIAPEHQDKIFERFYRVDKSHSRQSGGTGLGLSIVKHAVQLHGGVIIVESEKNKGTAITVVIPKENMDEA